MATPNTLQDVLSPFSKREFLESFWGRRCCLVKGSVNKFSQLFSWGKLNRTLFQYQFDFPRVRLLKEGEVFPPNYYISYQLGRAGMKIPILQRRKIETALADGAVLNLTAVERTYEPLTVLVNNLGLELCGNIVVNLYAGLANSRGLGVHWDDHDVIIAQISGTKKWNVFGVGRPYPVRSEAVENCLLADLPIFEVVLEQGDCLYIPRGWWHSAEARNVPTLHLTMGITNRTGIDFLVWLSTELRAREVYRKDLPVFSTREEQERHMECLREELLRLWTDDILNRYLGAYKATLADRNILRLPNTLA